MSNMADSTYSPTNIESGGSAPYPAGTIASCTTAYSSGSGTPSAKITNNGTTSTITEFPHTDVGITTAYTVYNSSQGEVDLLVTPSN